MNTSSNSIILIILSFFLINCKRTEHTTHNSVVEKENWVSLFNGVDLENWTVKITGHPLGDNWNNTFRVVDSAIRVDYSDYKTFENSFGHIFYKTPYSNYRFKMTYRFLGDQIEGGENWALRNSGVMIHCQSPESMELDQNFPVCVEVQLLGGITENESRSTANLCTPGTHVSIDHELVTAHCIDSNSETYYGEQWIDLEIEVRNDSVIRHYINGKQVMEYEHPVIGGEYNTLTDLDGKPLKMGFISLQSESHPVEFKNIMLLELH
jgi:hypothetical protein